MGDEAKIAKLEKWVSEHPREAKAVHTNMSTLKTYTIEDVLGYMKGSNKVDPEMAKVIKQVEQWLEVI